MALVLAAASPALAQVNPSDPAVRAQCRTGWTHILQRKLAWPKEPEGLGPALLVVDEANWNTSSFEDKSIIIGLYECATFGTLNDRRIEIRSSLTNKPIAEWSWRGLVVR